MIELIKPTFSQEEVFSDCIENIIKEKEKLIEKKTLLNDSYRKYEELANINELHNFLDPLVNLDESIQENFKKLYKNKFSKDGHKARKYYNNIKNYKTKQDKTPIIHFNDEHNICPMCHTSEVDTLDHYLPKSKYPSLSINPLNLIPICNKCNKNKGAYSSSCREKNLIHLYFDEFSNISWLKCEIISKYNIKEKCINMEIDFSVKQDETNIDRKELLYRINNTFKKYKIDKAYEIEAQHNFQNLIQSYTSIFSSNGEKALREAVDDRFKHYDSKKGWELAFYHALITQEIWDEFIVALKNYLINSTFS